MASYNNNPPFGPQQSPCLAAACGPIILLMDDSILLQELETLAAGLDIEVRYDDFEGQGGLCRYGGRSYLIVNHELDTSARVHLFCRVLSRLPLDAVFIRPQVRERIEKCGSHAAT